MRSLVLSACLCLAPLAGAATPVAKALPGAELRGQASFKFLGFQIYEARLFTKGGTPLDWSRDFGLELTYKRKLSQNDLIEGTLLEMKRMGNAAPTRAQLKTCYQSVTPGDRYLAVSQGLDQLTFWRNERAVCTLSQKDIKAHFMAIFLGEDSRSRRFTQTLLGL